MGFRLNSNAALGVAIGIIFLGAGFALTLWLPLRLGWVHFSANPQSSAIAEGVPSAVLLIVGGVRSPINGTMYCITAA